MGRYLRLSWRLTCPRLFGSRPTTLPAAPDNDHNPPNQMKSSLLRTILLASVLPLAASHAAAAEAPYLWQLGRADNKPSEFALAPGGFGHYRQDGFHVVGASNPQADWPYVHPGPHDQWAGSQPHSFVVVFGLKQAPASGEGRLEIDLLDTHAGAPPKLRIDVNGHAPDLGLPPGGGDPSVQRTTGFQPVNCMRAITRL